MEIIDAHQHIWSLAKAEYSWMDPDDAVIHRDYTIDDAVRQLDAVGVDGTVLVQSADNPEDSRTMFAAARATERVRGVVAWVPLDDPRETERLLGEWSREPAFCGIRSLIHDRDDASWFSSPGLAPALTLLAERGITFDVVAVQPAHLRAMIEVGERHPDLRMVIDHLGHPPIKATDAGEWSTLIAEAAANPRVHAKVSGLYPVEGAMDEWTSDDIAPFVDHALELFGAERLMYGGDWPISELAGGYTRVWEGLSALFARWDSRTRARVCAGTATEFYGLRGPNDEGATAAPEGMNA